MLTSVEINKANYFRRREVRPWVYNRASRCKGNKWHAKPCNERMRTTLGMASRRIYREGPVWGRSANSQTETDWETEVVNRADEEDQSRGRSTDKTEHSRKEPQRQLQQGDQQENIAEMKATREMDKVQSPGGRVDC